MQELEELVAVEAVGASVLKGKGASKCRTPNKGGGEEKDGSLADGAFKGFAMSAEPTLHGFAVAVEGGVLGKLNADFDGGTGVTVPIFPFLSLPSPTSPFTHRNIACRGI